MHLCQSIWKRVRDLWNKEKLEGGCRLSKRKLTSTRASLTGGNFMGMMNILMQPRKVCNHPDLFESRPIDSPFVAESINFAL